MAIKIPFSLEEISSWKVTSEEILEVMEIFDVVDHEKIKSRDTEINIIEDFFSSEKNKSVHYKVSGIDDTYSGTLKKTEYFDSTEYKETNTIKNYRYNKNMNEAA